jgi:bacterioferritin-associated ferredoxin
MFVCLCNGISDQEIRHHVRRGASSWREVARACGAGAACGDCRPSVHALVEEELRQVAASETVPMSPVSLPAIAP